MKSIHEDQLIPFGRWVIIAGLFSLVIHVGILMYFQQHNAGFGHPIIAPYEPPRFHLQRAVIDSKDLEPANPPPQREVELDPQKMATFDTPLEKPSIPVPKMSSDAPILPAMSSLQKPVQAFSSLPIEAEGNTSSLAQSLADQATTAALKETQNLQPIPLPGGKAPSGSGSDTILPKFEDISNLLKFRHVTAVERPPFQPILIRLSSDVLFAFDSYQLQSNAFPTLQEVARVLSQAPKAKITVEGYTDTIGDDAYNLKLSKQRAQTVADWLKQQPSLASQDFFVRGYGKAHPLVNPNGTIEEQKLNRRVEIRVEAEK